MSSHSLSAKFFLTILGLLLFAGPSIARTEVVDRVVAIVNDDVITLRDLQEEGAPIFKQIRNEAPPMQAETALRQARREVLSSLIDKTIIEQRAKQLQVAVSDAELANAFQEVLTRQGLTEAALVAELSRRGITEERYRATLRAQILQSKLVSYEVRSKVVITDDKAKAYYDSHYAAAPTEKGLHILQLGIGWEDPGHPRTREEARKLANELRDKAAAGGDFQQLARENSTLPSAVDGGDIGVFKQDEIAPFMRTALADVKPGEVSAVVETADTFQFFKLLSGKGGTAPYESVKDEIHRKLYDEELEQNFKKWVQQLREQANIKELL